jgi:hypothetical protein
MTQTADWLRRACHQPPGVPSGVVGRRRDTPAAEEGGEDVIPGAMARIGAHGADDSGHDAGLGGTLGPYPRRPQRVLADKEQEASAAQAAEVSWT